MLFTRGVRSERRETKRKTIVGSNSFGQSGYDGGSCANEFAPTKTIRADINQSMWEKAFDLSALAANPARDSCFSTGNANKTGKYAQTNF